MRVLFFVLLATCLLVADAKGKKHKKNEEAKKAKARSGAGRMNGRDSKGERVWHFAESEEECGNYTELYQRLDKPYDLCSEVNVTMNICSTRDTEVMTMEGEDTEETEAAAEPRHHDEEDHDHDMYTPKDEAEWDFKSGTCVFRLHMEEEDSDEESSEANGRKKNKKKGGKKNKKMTKTELKRVQERSKLRKKLKEKKEAKNSPKNSRSRKAHKNKKQIAPAPRTVEA